MRAAIASAIGKSQAVVLEVAVRLVAPVVAEAQHGPAVLEVLLAWDAPAAAGAGGEWSVAMNDEERLHEITNP